MAKKFKIDVMLGKARIETISRVLTGKAIGNFNPIYCRYQKREHLVMSREGDLSDPFRRDDSYLEKLYIQV